MPQNESVRLNLRRTLRIDLALRLIWQSAPGWTIISLLLIVVQGPLPLLSLYLMKLIVNTVTAGLTSSDKGSIFREALILIILMGAVNLLSCLLSLIAGLVNETQAHLVTDHIYDVLHAKSIAVDLEYYENSQYYDTLHRAQEEAPYRPTSILEGVVQLGQSGISLLAMVGLLFSFHWGIVVILFGAALPGVLMRFQYARKLYRWEYEWTPTERQSWHFNWMLTADLHAKEIRLFDLGALFMRRFRGLRKQLRRERLKIAVRYSIIELMTRTVAILAVFGSYACIAYRAVLGSITLGDLVMYYQAFQRGHGFLQGMLSSLAGLFEDNLFLSGFYEFLDLEQKVIEPLHPKPVPRPMQSGIMFEHVSFQYPTGSRKVLEDISLIIHPGEKVALVGENGAGKTTLIKLLCRLYDPTGGAITLDGMDLREFDPTSLRREISVIFQDYVQYNLTARENIWFGNINLASDHERIVAAAHDTGADEVISGLKHGYETFLGKWFEDGEKLSTGEWQKIALARAFLRDAQILVLDEPTSALDANAEYEIFTKFQQLTKNQTTLLISHRFSTVKMADRIYVLEDGRIVENGSHTELIRRGGTYARLFETQAQYYR